jgi:hypothetical protein
MAMVQLSSAPLPQQVLPLILIQVLSNIIQFRQALLPLPLMAAALPAVTALSVLILVVVAVQLCVV